jgi:MSHA pilin protein MshD
VTLIELIIAIVVVSISLAAVMSVFVVTTQHSADPMARVQAQIIAEGYLDEVLLKKFYDTTTSKVCPGGAASHADYVCGYNGLSEAVPGVTGYTAAVAVTSTGVTLGSLNNTGAIRVLRVDVTITGPDATTISLTGFRTNYQCNAPADPGCVPLS